ncbi:ornithine carbamoyltransferase, partial [Candidatus Bathyarchaeota archaeon]
DLMLMAEASRVPVINGCDEKYHPCQAITDLMTMKEKKGSLEGVKLVYIGVHNNVCNSLIEICTKLGVEITTVTPIIHESAIDKELLAEAKKSGFYRAETDVKKAVKDADFVYTDTWVDMELFLDPKFKEEKEKRIKLMMPYQVNSQLLAESKALIMHDMPIHRGYEISGEAVESPRSIIYEQAENRLYTAKAILLRLLERQG